MAPVSLHSCQGLRFLQQQWLQFCHACERHLTLPWVYIALVITAVGQQFIDLCKACQRHLVVPQIYIALVITDVG